MKGGIVVAVLLAVAVSGCSNPETSGQTFADTVKPASVIKDKWHWGDSARQSVGAGYAQVVKTGNTLYISGIPTSDTSAKGIEALYQGLEKSLQAYGAGFEHVVKENLFTTDIERMQRHNATRKQFYKNDFPAATWVQISRLYEKTAWVEVDLIAVLPE